MNLIQGISEVFSLNIEEPKFHCKVFDDNNSCISTATSNKLSTRTNHIEIKYNHFQPYVKEK